MLFMHFRIVLSMTMGSTARIDELRAAADSATASAVAARELALEVTTRRAGVVTRADECIALHTPEVWSSRAAIDSRTELQRSVAWSLWLAGESLGDTSVALEVHADELDQAARSYRRQADDVAAQLASAEALGPIVDMSWLDGVA